jgi:hypothetical protein
MMERWSVMYGGWQMGRWKGGVWLKSAHSAEPSRKSSYPRPSRQASYPSPPEIFKEDDSKDIYGRLSMAIPPVDAERNLATINHLATNSMDNHHHQGTFPPPYPALRTMVEHASQD